MDIPFLKVFFTTVHERSISKGNDSTSIFTHFSSFVNRAHIFFAKSRVAIRALYALLFHWSHWEE
jgi:hypothetical protein